MLIFLFLAGRGLENTFSFLLLSKTGGFTCVFIIQHNNNAKVEMRKERKKDKKKTTITTTYNHYVC